MINKKLNQGKVLLKLLVVLKVLVEQACVEAILLKDVAAKDGVLKLCLKAMLLQAVLLEDLSRALSAKLKLLKAKAGKVLLLQAILQKGLTIAELKLVKVEAVQCKGGLEALFCEAMLKAPP